MGQFGRPCAGGPPANQLSRRQPQASLGAGAAEHLSESAVPWACQQTLPRSGAFLRGTWHQRTFAADLGASALPFANTHTYGPSLYSRQCGPRDKAQAPSRAAPHVEKGHTCPEPGGTPLCEGARARFRDEERRHSPNRGPTSPGRPVPSLFVPKVGRAPTLRPAERGYIEVPGTVAGLWRIHETPPASHASIRAWTSGAEMPSSGSQTTRFPGKSAGNSAGASSRTK
jgi:hypothetical protein